MEILAWDGKLCDCRPQCDAERAEAVIRCNKCGIMVSVTYADEGSLLDLNEWHGGESPCQWHCQIWDGGAGGMSILLPNDQVTPENQWLADINNMLENDAYQFP